jgi:nitroreductase
MSNPTSNSTIEAIFARRSVRAYTDKKVDDATIELLAKIALAAPSGNNFQPVNVVIVRDAALIREAEKAVIAYFVKKGETNVVNRIKSRNDKIFYDAPVLFVLTVKNKSNTDVGIAAENISIAATSLGLGSILLGLPNVIFNDPDTAAYWKGKLGIGEGCEYGLVVAVGYAADTGKPHDIDVNKISYINA